MSPTPILRWADSIRRGVAAASGWMRDAGATALHRTKRVEAGTWLIAALVVLIVVQMFVAAVVIYWLYDGAIFGDNPRRYARVLIVAIALIATLCVLRIRRYSPWGKRGQETQTTALAAIAVAGAAWGLVGLCFPTTPASAVEPPCQGAPTTAGGQQVQTRDGGVNVRAEPSIIADQIGRLGGNCTIAVDGYCVGGTPLHDRTNREVDYVDVRWFRLVRIRGWDQQVAQKISGDAPRDRFVAAATITSFVTDKLVPQLPRSKCPTSVRNPTPGTPEIKQTDYTVAKKPGDPTSATFQVTADNTYEFGIALLLMGHERTGNPYRKVANRERPDDVTLQSTWVSSQTARYINAPTPVVVYGGRCYAIGAPVPTSRAKSAVLAYVLGTDGTLTPTTVPKLTRTQINNLNAMACREDSP